MGAAARIIIVLALIAAAFYYRDTVKIFALQAYREVAPCTVPITYSIERIDPRFRTSTSTLERSSRIAEGLWEEVAEKELFTYVPSGGALKIFLEYDTRQATTQKLQNLGVAVDADLETYNASLARYEDLYNEYVQLREHFESEYGEYQRRVRAYEAEVNRWNARGGAPSSVYDQLQEEKAALEREESRLVALQDRINNKARDVNALVNQLNRLARELNISVDTYNRVGGSLGEEFEEALYESRPGSQSITIFEFGNESKLTRVLAHEFGHALGLEHEEDENAIMYRLNASPNQSLSEADVRALESLCRI